MIANTCTCLYVYWNLLLLYNLPSTAFRCAYCYELNPARKTKPNITTRVSTNTLPPLAAPAPLSETTAAVEKEEETVNDIKKEEKEREHDAKGIEESES